MDSHLAQIKWMDLPRYCRDSYMTPNTQFYVSQLCKRIETDFLGMLQGQGFSWGQVIGYGLKLAFAALGGTNNNIEHDGVDKIGVEGGATPVQVCFSIPS